jgi:glycosyltransferase involved in cell wall biosynthesis
MPLPNGLWERGKCGYKIIQYMASWLPVVASPVGANTQIVEPGITGFLADSLASWMSALLYWSDTQAEPTRRCPPDGYGISWMRVSQFSERWRRWVGSTARLQR